VFVSGIVGGWIGGAVSQALFLPLMFHTSPKSLAAQWMLVILIGGLCQAAITGGVLLPLLPPVSDVHVGFGTTFIAVLVGKVITIGGTLLLLHATVQSHLEAGGDVGLLPALRPVLAAVGDRRHRGHGDAHLQRRSRLGRWQSS
jgi:hypothetical protein